MRALPRLWVAVLVAALALSAAGTVEKYLGLGGVAAFSLYAAVAVLAWVALAPRLARRLSDRSALALGAATLVGLGLAFALVYPHTDTTDPAKGSDRDDALRIATERLLDGDYPYGGLTYQGNPMYELPGGIVLAAPFTAVGALGFQNLLWLAALFLVLRRSAGAAAALLATWLALLSPELWRELLTGGDVIANVAAVAALAIGLVSAHRARAPALTTLALAAGLGVVLSWRATFLPLVPLVFAVVARVDGRGAAARSTLTALAAFTAVTLPFYVAAPDRFTPADAGDKLEPYTSTLPHAPLVVPALAFALALALAALPSVRDEWSLAAAFVPVIALPHLAFVVLDSISQGRLSFYQLIDSHGLGWLVFACAATALLLGRDRRRIAAGPGFYT